MNASLTFFKYLRHSPAWQSALQLRRQELRVPLGLDYSSDDLAAESDEHHFGAANDAGNLIASLNMKPVGPGTWKMRQVVVAPEWRGRNVGRNLIDFAEAAAQKAGIRQIVLHARLTVVGFYERLGYQAEGPVFTEVTLPHRILRRILVATHSSTDSCETVN